jgi:hypothetical protein
LSTPQSNLLDAPAGFGDQPIAVRHGVSPHYSPRT